MTRQLEHDNSNSIVGKYLDLKVSGTTYKIYYEEAGAGIPLCCLHTAAADSRQFHELMLDRDVTDRFRVLAFDLPAHGRSEPIPNWLRETHKLTGKFYRTTIMEFCRSLALERPIILGCSMGGSIVLELALLYPSSLGGVIGLETTAHSSGRLIEFLDHPHINAKDFISHYVSGLISPEASRWNRERILWYYGQAGPRVFAEDMNYYYTMDIRDKISRIDTRKCPVYLLTGEHDYSCAPEMTIQTAAKINGAKVRIMKGLGHFPMTENYVHFKKYLMPVLNTLEKTWRDRFGNSD